MAAPDDIQRLETERLRPIPAIDPLTELFTRLLDLIVAECRRHDAQGRQPRFFNPKGITR